MEDKRLQIIKQSASLFHQFGIKSVSMDDIARELGMSKKTLYQFIKDKNDLVESVVEFNRDLFTDFLSAFKNNSLNAIEQFYSYQMRMIEHFPKYNPSMLYDLKKYYPLLLNDIIEKRKNLMLEANIANLEKGKKEGFYHADIDSKIISKLQVGNQNYVFDPSNGLFTDADLNDHKVLEQLYKYHFRGICTQSGIDELKRVFKHVYAE
nr:TetR/AcrR family transcriptional regulator [uncultured Carboxylicivirga sp.]